MSEMRILIDLVEAAKFEDSNYGFYITDNGTVHAIQRGDSHDDCAERLGMGGKDGASFGGWVRVVHKPGDWIVAQFDARHVTKKALASFYDVIRAGRYTNLDREPMTIDEVGLGHQWNPTTSTQLLALVKKLIASIGR